MSSKSSPERFGWRLLSILIVAVLCLYAGPALADSLVLGLVPQAASPLLSQSGGQWLTDYLAEQLKQPVTLRSFNDPQNLLYWMARFREVDFGLFDQDYLDQHGRGEFVLLAACRPRGQARPLLLVARRGVEPAVFTAVGRALLEAGSDSAGRELLQQLGISSFLPPAKASAATPAELPKLTTSGISKFHIDYPVDGGLTGPDPLLEVTAPAGSRLLLDGSPLTRSSGEHFGPLTDGGHRLELISPAGMHLVRQFRVDAQGPLLTVDPFPTSLRDTELLLRGSHEPDARLHLAFPEGLSAGRLWFPSAGRWELALADIQPGRHRLNLFALDRYGNQTRLEISFERDLTAPQLQILSPEAGREYQRLPLLKLQAEAGDLRLVLDGQPLPGQTLPKDLANGEHTLQVELRDRAGNLSQRQLRFRLARKPLLLTVDPQPPSLQQTDALLTGHRSAGTTLAVKVNPVSVSAQISYPASERWELVLEGLGEGENRVDLQLSDADGNRTEQQLRLLVDRTPPHLDLVSPPAGDIPDAKPILKFALSDGSLKVWLDGRPLTVTNGEPLGPLVDGRHELLLNAVDAAGNRSQLRRVFTIDTRPPTVTISAPVAGAAVRPPVRPQWRISDANAQVEARLDGVPIAAKTGQPLAGLAPGRHRLEVTATDTAGNRGVAKVEFKVPGKGPEVYLTSPMAGVTYDNTPLLEYRAGAGLVRVLVDGHEVDKQSGQSLDALADGPHTVRVEVTDAAGDIGSAEQRFAVSAAAASRLLKTASPLEMPPVDEPFAITLPRQDLPAGYSGSLQLTIRGLSRLGETVYLQQWLDSNHNGVADANEPVVEVTRLTDGLASPASGVPGDEDGVENRVIVTHLDFSHPGAEEQRPGQYILLAIGEQDVSETVLRIH